MLADDILCQGIIFAALYFLLCGALLLVFRCGGRRWLQYKLDDTTANPGQLRREIRYSLLSLLVFIAGGFFTYWLYEQGYTRMYSLMEDKGYLYSILSFFLTLLLQDGYFYWAHRFMHLPGVYSAIHRTHHLSHHTTVFSAMSFHPGEALIQVAFIPLVTLVLPMPVTVLYSFIVYNLTVNILGHSGYDFFPMVFKKSVAGKISNTPVHHHLHHRFVRKNYGLYLNLWDKFMGTYKNNTEEGFN